MAVKLYRPDPDTKGHYKFPYGAAAHLHGMLEAARATASS